MRLLRARVPLSMCAAVVQTAPTVPAMDRLGRAALCRRHSMRRHLTHVLKVSILGVTGKVHLVRWEMSIRKSAQIHEAAARKPDARSALDVRGIMRNDRTTGPVAMAQASEASQDKNKSVALIASVVTREVATERAVNGIASEKASAQVAKGEESGPAVSAANHAKGANPVRASLTVALATRADHQDQEGKSAIAVAEVEADPATMDESDLVSLRTSRTAT
jgi:hypothetical protein